VRVVIWNCDKRLIEVRASACGLFPIIRWILWELGHNDLNKTRDFRHFLEQRCPTLYPTCGDINLSKGVSRVVLKAHILQHFYDLLD